MTTFKGMNCKAEFDGATVSITKKGTTRTFPASSITTVTVTRGRAEFGLQGEETSNARLKGLKQGADDVYNTRVLNWAWWDKSKAEAFLAEVQAAKVA